MNPLLRQFLSATLGLLILAGPALHAAAAVDAPSGPKVKLIFVDWEKFTDIAVASAADKSGSDLIFRELERHLASLAKYRLAPGQTLVVKMRDIDLAGAIEPWRGPDFGRVRYLRDTLPPRLAFDYQLLDAKGTVLKEGSEKLTNLTFRYQAIMPNRDTTFFEKQLLSDWMADTFDAPRKPKKTKKP